MTKQIWKALSLLQETGDSITIKFDTMGSPFDYQPGQYIDLGFEWKGELLRRSYSLSSVPGLDENPAITVKRVEGGLVSSILTGQPDSIKEWMIEGPFGQFTPGSSSKPAKHYVLLAGGSGITPLYAIAKYLLHFSDATITLVYASRNWESTIFGQELLYLSQSFSHRLKLLFALSAEKDEGLLPPQALFKGRLTRLALKKILRPVLQENADGSSEIFICGPQGLNEMGIEVMKELGVDESGIHLEWFNPVSIDPEEGELEDQQVLIHFYEQTNLLDVKAGQSILAAALGDRIPVSYSCQTGTCGRCAAKLVSGKVKMAANYALNKDDLNAGLVLLCQAYPGDDQVTVSVNGVEA
ncbi:iron-sulfur cluster-binding domain-containing protein [Flavihumibacter rivuli]|uniref:flavin reductase family protein n=1 Tax=Flavihumibacter rivuli TaxID=2838156 RepID=UPI001BDEE265|nr:iron-sulfur cluster-binding domain-containing protein [Flavihumibacter rivuli]ULQ58240.1 iron-sulfur cluster-binding domain-containing protein [Flavihumibacter rivuli]